MMCGALMCEGVCTCSCGSIEVSLYDHVCQTVCVCVGGTSALLLVNKRKIESSSSRPRGYKPFLSPVNLNSDITRPYQTIEKPICDKRRKKRTVNDT